MKPLNRIMTFLFTTLILISGCKKNGTITEGKIKPNDFLSDKKYNKLVVTVVYETGFALSSETIRNLQNFLSGYLNKPDGIIFDQKEISNQGRNYVSLSDLNAIEKQFRKGFSGRKTIEVFVYVSSGEWADNAGNSKVLGVAYGNTSIALFGKTINSYSGGLTQPPRAVLETTVADHEFGHLMGLVDNGTNMVEYHRDVNNGHHCDKKNCLMYYAAETSDIVSNLLGGDLPGLENYCIRDLQFNGGK